MRVPAYGLPELSGFALFAALLLERPPLFMVPGVLMLVVGALMTRDGQPMRTRALRTIRRLNRQTDQFTGLTGQVDRAPQPEPRESDATTFGVIWASGGAALALVGLLASLLS